MDYTQLEKSYKYETIASAIYGREAEHFHYDFDRKNFEYLIANADDEPFKADIEKRLGETMAQMANVAKIIDALAAQIDDQAAYAKAVEVVKSRRNAKEV